MVLHAEQIFDKVYLDREHPSDLIEFITSNLGRELVTKLINELGDHKLHAIQLSESEFIEDLPEVWSSAVKQHLNLVNLVQCKNCRMHFPWCQKFKFELGGNGFCPYGKEIENEQ